LGKLHNRTATEEELYDHLYNNFNDIRSATMLDTMEKQIKLILEESN
jgi:ribosomal protein S15P/S13E